MSAAVLSLVVFVPTVGSAQAPTLVGSAPPIQFGGKPPEVTAAGAAWQVNGESIIVDGLEYQATREFRIFDANIMAQVALYQRVPIYADTTIEPFTVMYVPVGSSTMRAYEHTLGGHLAAMSRMPAGSSTAAATEPEPVGTAGTTVPRTALPTTSLRRPAGTETSLRARARNSIWLEFAGARYDSDGEAAVFSADRFTKIGEYRGFPVYREVDDVKKDRIWVTLAHDGPVAPFVKR